MVLHIGNTCACKAHSTSSVPREMQVTKIIHTTTNFINPGQILQKHPSLGLVASDRVRKAWAIWSLPSVQAGNLVNAQRKQGLNPECTQGYRNERNTGDHHNAGNFIPQIINQLPANTRRRGAWRFVTNINPIDHRL